jgi:dienelactone hydrolase
MQNQRPLHRWVRETRRERHQVVSAPPMRAWRGAAMGSGLAAAVLLVYLAAGFNTRLGLAGDILLSLVGGALLGALGWAVAAGLVALLRFTPPVWLGLVAGAFAAAAGAMALTGTTQTMLQAWLFALALVLPVGLFGWAIGLGADHVLEPTVHRGGRYYKFLVLAVALLVGLEVQWLKAPGPAGPALPVLAEVRAVAPLQAPNPAEPGGFAVRTMTYGSGTDLHRPEFGPKAQVKTEPVDARPFLRTWSGTEGWLRTKYWGFGPDRAPLNGRVWYPAGEGPFPLVLMLHGNYAMTTPSDTGYNYLGELLASRGYVVASVDMNFLGRSFAGDLGGEANAARAWLLLQHLEQFQRWNATLGTALFRKVDMGNIALVGHSRGGEAAYLAAVFNDLPYWPDDANIAFSFNFKIKSVAALAPTDGQYRPSDKLPPLQNVNYLVLHGSGDGDVVPFEGSRALQRVSFADGIDGLKAALYIRGANHGQFNTTWGRRDWNGLASRLINVTPLLDGEQQRTIAKVYLSAFLDITLKGQRQYLPLLRDPRVGAPWLPPTAYVSRYTDGTMRAAATFEEDVNLLTTTAPGGFARGEGLAAWREEGLALRAGRSQENTALYLAWNEGGQFYLTLPDHLAKEWRLDTSSALTFAVADARSPADGQEPLDFTVEVFDAAGARGSIALSSLAPLRPREQGARLYKLGKAEEWLLGEPDIILQTYVLPLHELVAGTGLAPASLRTIRLVFDRSAQGAIYLDDVGFLQVGR